MTHPDILAYENEQVNADLEVPRVGDTVAVSSLITEGKKQRIQKFQGIVIKVQGKASRLSITVRKIIDKIGAEKTFLVYSNLVKNIEIVKKGKVRRARLNYLRDRLGAKATKVKTRT
jgi:large subunit ribosomal protein L19